MVQQLEKEGVTCIQMNFEGRRKVFSFLVDGMLVDTGAQSIESDLIPVYKELSFDFVALTHSHEDHAGNASWIQENRDVPLYIHPKGVDRCAEPCTYPKYRQDIWGIRQSFKALPLEDNIRSRNYEWKVIYTPGHSDDHISLFHEESGRLFSGDLFVTPKTKVMMRSESFPQMVNSIRTLLRYDFSSVFAAMLDILRMEKQ
ncbi:MBL fold metallo-hydrolase [Desertibacillus haloalkaliphilus]|uniref:MBL fold metallo-hydrolase n=1 Tax=Desertibacillus haloalkaliphilus TaxID=1328930 RepID=UPI001FE620D9|nr:MBL fold metallo-hydrolase [Desertibacillus haloalkaliphilus]